MSRDKLIGMYRRNPFYKDVIFYIFGYGSGDFMRIRVVRTKGGGGWFLGQEDARDWKWLVNHCLPVCIVKEGLI